MPIRFRDRKDAGIVLARRLMRYARQADAIVLGLPRGGVVTAFEIANALELPLDVLIIRKLGTPGQTELAMGAIARGGTRVLNEDVIRLLGISQQQIDEVAAREEKEAERRELIFRGDHEPLSVSGNTVIVVDDGLATGSTMLAAVRVVKAQKPTRLVVAIPVAPQDTCDRISREVDELVCLSSPVWFNAVGEWYEDFTQTTDQEVVDLLRTAATRRPALVG